MSRRKEACFPRGMCDREGRPGSRSQLYYINSWAMILSDEKAWHTLITL